MHTLSSSWQVKYLLTTAMKLDTCLIVWTPQRTRNTRSIVPASTAPSDKAHRHLCRSLRVEHKLSLNHPRHQLNLEFQKALQGRPPTKKLVRCTTMMRRVTCWEKYQPQNKRGELWQTKTI